MNNLQKRILTSIIIFPLSIFFIIKGGYFLLSFLLVVFLVANYELFSVFSKKKTIVILELILILSFFSIYYLAEPLKEVKGVTFYFLLWIIILCVSSDIGGYVVGKIFKWKKLTTISPNKTLSGVLGSFAFSLLSIFIADAILLTTPSTSINFLEARYFFLAIIFSLVAQTGDLIISYFKRLNKVKNTGSILPGHGGLLDRIDGIIFAIPCFGFLGYLLNFLNY